MTPPQESFLDRLSVSPAEDDLVAVTVYLPPDLVQDYRRFLESVSTFFQRVDRKTSTEAVKAREVKRQVIEYDKQNNLAVYHKRISKAFDEYTLSGLDRKEAIKRVAADLRASKHPWSCPELVSSPISPQGGFDSLELLPSSSRFYRPYSGPVATPPDRTASGIQGFSDKSRSRLRFTAANSSHLLISQFCCTYHNVWPISGRVFKKRHLDVFLTDARRVFPGLKYLWVAEFQTRGAPHAHVYLNLPATDENRYKLAFIWCRIVDANDSQLLAFHSHSSNMCSWKMGTGSYLCKYLDKQHQKFIPEGFHSFGRWWGNSRGLVPPAEMMTPEDIREYLPLVNEETGEVFDDPVKFLFRTVGRYHEKINRRSWFRRTNRTTSALTGAPIFRQAFNYLCKLRRLPPRFPDVQYKETAP